VRKPNAAYRSREHLTEREVERLIEAAKNNRWGHRDSTMVLLAFRHGPRASELVDLRWEQIDLENAILHVRRVKQGTPATHPLTGRELRALRRLQREQESKSPFVFVSERGAPFSTRGFQAMVERAAKVAGFDMKIHPHMLRHSCGYKLANDGVDTRTIQSYLGHRSIRHTFRYTELAPTRFKKTLSLLERTSQPIGILSSASDDQTISGPTLRRLEEKTMCQPRSAYTFHHRRDSEKTGRSTSSDEIPQPMSITLGNNLPRRARPAKTTSVLPPITSMYRC
jgi:hypothetical protein